MWKNTHPKLIHVTPISAFALGCLFLLFGSIIRVINSPIMPINPQLAYAQANTWFVSPAGNDGSNCSTSATPCLTIQTAITKAAQGDTIRIAVGIYTGSSNPAFTINKSITLSGGWNAAFTAQSGRSTLDGQLARRVMEISGSINVILENLEIMNGYWTESGSGGGIYVYQAHLTLQNCDIHHNVGGQQSHGAGITNQGTLLIISSTIRDNSNGENSFGGGIFSGGPLIIDASTISNNNSSEGGGIFSSGAMTVTNSTVSGNSAESHAGGIRVQTWQPIKIISTTILKNISRYGGAGITADIDDDITISNTILANNFSPMFNDCMGKIKSGGYNIIEHVSIECDFQPSTGDIVDIDFETAPLGDYGGTSKTHALYPGNPAIDAGNPGGCNDGEGNLLSYDQRGESRTLDGNLDGDIRCDIGAYELDPNNPPPPPLVSIWYVKTSGDDTQDCLSPGTACRTINSAVEKALSGGLIYIASGTYTGSGDQVVLVDKDIHISGSWNESFTQHASKTIIDGEGLRRGITIFDELEVQIDHLTVQNGRNINTDGGGIRIGYQAQVDLANIEIINNRGDQPDPNNNNITLEGGGVYVHIGAKLDLSDCVISGNNSYNGGGVALYQGALSIKRCTFKNNTASLGGGLFSQGTVEVSDSLFETNHAAEGGGIYADFGNFTLTNSSLVGNSATGGNPRGGGIYAGDKVVIQNSRIYKNKAGFGGGISSSCCDVKIINSTIARNWAFSSGGGIWMGASSNLINSTISNNLAYFQGGGIYNTVYASNVTIANNIAFNAGGGIYSPGVSLRNSLLGNNFAPYAQDCTGNLTAGSGYNLIEDVTGCDISASQGDLTNIEAGISLMRGSPAYYLLPVESPAIDAGNPNGCVDKNGAQIVQDQRGGERPLDGDGVNGAQCDIGSFEYNPNEQFTMAYLPMLTSQLSVGKYFDEFEDPFSGWPFIQDSSVFAKYLLTGAYEINGLQNNSLYLIRAPFPALYDYTYRIDANWLPASEGASYGLLFGIQGDFERYYFVEVSSENRQYRLIRYEDNQFVEVKSWTYDNVIKNDDWSINELAITLNSNSFRVTINDKVVGSWSDSNLRGPTYTGLAASSWANVNIFHANFDHYQLESSASGVTQMNFNDGQNYLMGINKQFKRVQNFDSIEK